MRLRVLVDFRAVCLDVSRRVETDICDRFMDIQSLPSMATRIKPLPGYRSRTAGARGPQRFRLLNSTALTYLYRLSGEAFSLARANDCVSNSIPMHRVSRAKHSTEIQSVTELRSGLPINSVFIGPLTRSSCAG